jgi:hypothetical protein
MRMRQAGILKVSLFIVVWLLFGGAYTFDVIDDVIEQSYEMNAAADDFEQGLEPDDKASLNGLSVSYAGNVETMVVCQALHTGTYAQPHVWLFHNPPTRPLHQLLSIYRI